MADLDRLEVQVEASAAKANAELDKMLGKLDKIVSSLSSFKLGKSVSLEAELKNVADSMEKVRQSAKGVTSPKMDISQIEQTVSSLKEQFKNIGKDFKFAGDAAQVEKEIAFLQSKFEKLRERENKAITLGKVDTVSFKSLQYDIALTTNKLSVLRERLKELTETGQPKVNFDLTEINQKVEEFREKFKDVGKNFEFTGNADQFYETLDTARGKLYELEQRNFQLIISGKVDEELQREIVKTENILDSLEQKRDEFASAPRIEIMGGYKDLSASINEFMRTMEEAGNVDKDFREKFESNLRNLKIPEINETNLDKLKSSLEKREADLERFRTKLENDITMGRISEDINDSGYRKAKEQIALTEKEIDALRTKIQEADSQAGGAEGFQVLQRMMAGLVFIGNTARRVLSGLNSAGNILKNSFSSLASRIKKATSGIAGLASKVKKLRDLMLGLGRTTKKSDASFANGLKTVLKYSLGIRSLYVLINRVRRAIIGGYENLAQYSEQVNFSISSMSSALLQLKNAFAVAFAPIVNVVAPYITAFINMLSNALNTVGRFFVALTGKTFAVQATKVYKDYAKGLSGVADAAEDAKKSLSVLGFDQLNQLQDSNTSNGSNGAGSGEILPTDMFTDVPIENAISEWAEKIRKAFLAGEWEELGAIIADGINTGLQKIYDVINWSNIGPKITYFVNAFTRTFNSIVEHINWDLMGRVIGAGINTLVNTFNLLVGEGGIDFEKIGTKLSVGFRGMLDEVEWINLGNAIGNKFMLAWRMFDGLVMDMWRKGDAGLTGWSQLGISVAESLNGIFQRINFGQIGSALGKSITGIFQLAIDFAGEFDWWALGFKIANGINEFLHNFDAKTVASGASEIIKGVLDSLITAVQETDWGLLGRKISDFLANIDWSGIAGGLFNVIGSALGGLTVFLVGAFQDIGKNIILGLLFGIGNINFLSWIKDHIFQPFIDGFKSMFGIHSPSTVMQEQGIYIMQGLFNGITLWIEKVTSTFEDIKNRIVQKWEETKQKTSETWNEVKTSLSTVWDGMKTNASSKFDSIKNSVSTSWANTKATTSSTWTNIKTSVSSIWSNMRSTASTNFQRIKMSISAAWDNVNSATSRAWGGISSAVKTSVNGIIRFINKMISSVVNGVNAVIDALNSVRFTMPKWLGGGSLHLDIPRISSYPQIPTFAQGGYPETGQLFLARENGLNEMVGRIGNRSAVANNDQIVEAVSSGVAGAMADVMMAFMGQSSEGAPPVLEFTFKIDSETAYRTVLKGKEKHDRRFHVVAEI